MDYLIGLIIAVVILGYLVLTIIDFIRFLRQDRINPEVNVLIQELKQKVDITNAKLDEAMKVVTQATTRYEVLQGVVSTDKQEIFSPKEEVVGELITLQLQCLVTKQEFLPERYSFLDIMLENVSILDIETARPAKGKSMAFALS